MLQQIIAERDLMQIWDPEKDDWPTRRKEIVGMLCREMYGYPPKTPERSLSHPFSESALRA